MQQKIVKVSPMMYGHLHLELEDGSMKVLHRGFHEEENPQVGDMWPPEAKSVSGPDGEA